MAHGILLPCGAIVQCVTCGLHCLEVSIIAESSGPFAY